MSENPKRNEVDEVETAVLFITEAEGIRSGLFPRDRKMIKPIRSAIKMNPTDVHSSLTASLENRSFVKLGHLLQNKDRSLAYFIRSLAYLHHDSSQSMRDALASIAFLPSSASSNALCPLVHEISASSLEREKKFSEALIHLLRSKESIVEQGGELMAHLSLKIKHISSKLDLKMTESLKSRCISPQTCLSTEIEKVLNDIEEAELPLCKRERKPFEFYEEMMKGKILALLAAWSSVDQKDEAVAAKLIKSLDADDLLLLLEHPAALLTRVDDLREVLRLKGPEGLHSLPPPPRLTFYQVMKMKDEKRARGLHLVEGGQTSKPLLEIAGQPDF